MKPKKHGKRGVEILIAEDSPTQAAQLAHLLAEQGHAVTTAGNGVEALAAARRHKPALIISDILMPELDGYGLCKAIKSDEKLKAVPVVLVTTLSDPQDVMLGLECGADNFIRKPYDERYLLARIEYLLMNTELRKNQKMQMGVEIDLGGRKHFITAERQQILDLLISTYEQAVHINEELKLREKDLAHSNQVLNGLYRMAEGLNSVVGEREVAETALERALELPGVQAGWISLRDGEKGFRLAAARNLPPALAAPGALEGECLCRRRLLSGELDAIANILECERLAKADGDTQGLRYHASVPLWLGGRTLGVMNLAGPQQGLFDEEALKVLHSVGNQVAVALERARLHEHLEGLVEERTAKLKLFRTLLDNSNDAIEVLDPATLHFLDINETECRVLGYTREEILSMSVYDIDPAVSADAVEKIKAQLRQSGRALFETMHRRKDGSTFPVEASVTSAELDKPYLLAITRDITERKANEARIMRLNRIYSVLSGINTTIVRVREEGELFREACRIAVEHGKFILAWIGKLDADTQQVMPVAQAGRDDGYLAQINLTSRENTAGNCLLIAQALTEAKPVVCNDIASDERVAAWRSETLSRGYRSGVVLPLMLEGKPVGVFVLYAPEADVFDEEEMRLLVEMEGDISFALDNLKKEERLNYLAYYDVITGLPNRTLFWDRVEQWVGSARRDRNVFSVIMIDLERFSVINETLGRQAGDELLRQLAQRMKESLAETDILARLSADCYGIAAWCGGKGTAIAHVLERILLGIRSRPFVIGGKELRVAARAGVSSFPVDGEDVESLYRNAEAALKKAKLARDEYQFYKPEINARVAETLALENKLRRALEQEQFVLHYQPKVDLANARISGLEALIRWADPDGGLVPPANFIPLLEETGMIIEAGRWIMEKAMADFRKWQAKGLQPPRIAVNVSAMQLRQKDFVDSVERVLNVAGNVERCLELEITESLIMQDIEANIRKLKKIQDMSVEMAVDDFGTGYSSLSYIAKLPISTLKIDRAFIVNMTSSPNDLSIVSAIISLAHSLNLRVIAEGVETEEQANLLRLLKCDEIQGYLFSPAVAAEQIEQFLREAKTLPVRSPQSNAD